MVDEQPGSSRVCEKQSCLFNELDLYNCLSPDWSTPGFLAGFLAALGFLPRLSTNERAQFSAQERGGGPARWRSSPISFLGRWAAFSECAQTPLALSSFLSVRRRLLTRVCAVQACTHGEGGPADSAMELLFIGLQKLIWTRFHSALVWQGRDGQLFHPITTDMSRVSCHLPIEA